MALMRGSDAKEMKGLLSFRKGLGILGLMATVGLAILSYGLALLVMETGHYLGKGLPYWVLTLFPAFLIGRFARTLKRALIIGAAIPVPASLAAYLFLFVKRSGVMRLKGWVIDLWPWALLLAGLIIGSIALGRWVRGMDRRPRRWLTGVACPLVVLFAFFQIFLLLSGFIREVFFRVDLRALPRDQAVLAMGDFFRDHYNYLEHKGIDWDRFVAEAAAAAKDASGEEEFHRIVTTLVNTLGDGHLRIKRRTADKEEAEEVDLGVRWTKIDGRWFVLEVMEGSPASKAGWRRGTELLVADGQPPAALIAAAPHWRFNSQLGTFRGERFGERARLAFMLRRPDGSSLAFVLEAPDGERLSTELSYRKWDWTRPLYFDHGRLGGDIGYIRVARFVSDFFSLIQSFDRALEELWDTRGLIVDIRSNPGGYAFITDAMLDRFCDTRVYYGRLCGSGKGYTKLFLMPRRPIYRRPVIVLIDEFDFSAADLFAFAASAVPRLTLVGRPTGGLTSAPSQQKILLPDGLSLGFAFGSLTDADGNFVVEWTGVAPDLRVARTIEDLRSGRDRDLEAAIEWITATAPGHTIN